MYDISKGLLDKNKGFSIKSRLPQINQKINEAPFVYIQSDFDKCIKELGIDVNDNLPIPYLIKINIIDDKIKETIFVEPFSNVDTIYNQLKKSFDFLER